MEDNVERTLGRILATQEHIVKQMDTLYSKLNDHVLDDDKVRERVASLEHSKTYLLGVVASISLFIPYISDIVLSKLGLK